jgi:hypothetical protein
MNELAVEKQHISCPHVHWCGVHSVGQWDRHISEALCRVSGHRTQHWQLVTTGDYLETAIFFVTIIQSKPRSHTRPGFDSQVILVLVKCLPTRRWRFKIDHGLNRIWELTQDVLQGASNPRIEEKLHASFIPTMHLKHTWVAAQRVLVRQPSRITLVTSCIVQCHVVVVERSDLVNPKQACCYRISVSGKLHLQCCFMHESLTV